MRIMHINLNHGKAAHKLLRQTATGKQVGLVLLWEVYRTVGRGKWVIDVSEKSVAALAALVGMKSRREKMLRTREKVSFNGRLILQKNLFRDLKKAIVTSKKERRLYIQGSRYQPMRDSTQSRPKNSERRENAAERAS